jgi:ABC-type uncharacterized transport system ATPase subunit
VKGLELEDLGRRFGDLQALDHLTFSVPSGQVFGFIGANGPRKTTVMRAIFGLAFGAVLAEEAARSDGRSGSGAGARRCRSAR